MSKRTGVSDLFRAKINSRLVQLLCFIAIRSSEEVCKYTPNFGTLGTMLQRLAVYNFAAFRILFQTGFLFPCPPPARPIKRCRECLRNRWIFHCIESLNAFPILFRACSSAAFDLFVQKTYFHSLA